MYSIYFNELKRRNRGQPVELRIVERAGGMRRIIAFDSVHDALRICGPVRCRERETVVASSVHRIGLKNKTNHMLSYAHVMRVVRVSVESGYLRAFFF